MSSINLFDLEHSRTFYGKTVVWKIPEQSSCSHCTIVHYLAPPWPQFCLRNPSNLRFRGREKQIHAYTDRLMDRLLSVGLKISESTGTGSVQLYSDCIKNVLESSRPLFFCRMFWNVPDNRLKRRRLIEDYILSNPRQMQVYLSWLEPS